MKCELALEAMVEKLVIGVATLIKIRGKVLQMSLFKELWVPCYVFGVISVKQTNNWWMWLLGW